MANTQDSFTIDVNLNGSKANPTSPSRKTKAYNPTTISGFLKESGLKNYAAYSMIAGSAVSLGKTYVNLRFSKAENTNKAKRFDFGLKTMGSFGTIAGGAAMGGPVGAGAATVYVIAGYTNDVLTYNTNLQKKQLTFDYVNEKYQVNTANGSRFGGGSL